MAPRWRLVVAFLVLMSLNMCMVFALRARRRTRGDAIERQERVTAAVANWASRDAIQIDSGELIAAIQTIPTANCHECPPEAEEVSFGDMPPEQCSRLYEGIVGIVRAYAANDPQSVIRCMSGSAEVVSDKSTESDRKTLLARGDRTELEIEKLTSDELFIEGWLSLDTCPHWEALVPSASCIRVWRFGGHSGKELSQMRETAVRRYGDFRRIRTFVHRFAPVGCSLDDALERDGSVLVAEAVILVQHDAATGRRRWPYIFRYWHEPVENNWHPLALISIPSDPSAPRTTLRF